MQFAALARPATSAAELVFAAVPVTFALVVVDRIGCQGRANVAGASDRVNVLKTFVAWLTELSDVPSRQVAATAAESREALGGAEHVGAAVPMARAGVEI